MKWNNRVYTAGAAGIVSLCLFLSCVSCGEEAPEPEKKKKAPDIKKSSPAGTLPARKKPSVQKKKKSAFADREEGSFRIRTQSAAVQKEEKQKVNADHSNVQNLESGISGGIGSNQRRSIREKKAMASLRTKRPANSLAGRIAAGKLDQQIRWRPLMQEGTSGRSRIADCVISPDQSVLLFAETLGDREGPFGTRLVLMDTHSWTILKVHHLLDRYVRQISFVKDGNVLLSCTGQKALRTEDQILYWDPVRLTVLGEYAVPGVWKTFPSPDGKHFFATYRKDSANARQISGYALGADPGKGPVLTLTGSNAAPELAFSPDGQHLYGCSDRSLDYFDIKYRRLEQSIPLDEKFVCSDLLYLGSDLLAAAPERYLHQKAVLFQNGAKRPFGENSAGRFFELQDSKGKKFGSILSRKGKMAVVRTDSLEEIESIFPEERYPRTVGNPWRIFTLKHCPAVFAVLDTAGNFYLLFRVKNERSYRKELLLQNTRQSRK